MDRLVLYLVKASIVNFAGSGLVCRRWSYSDTRWNGIHEGMCATF